MLVKIDTILKAKNKTRYWLAKEASITYPNLVKLCENKTNSVKFDVLQKIRLVLECEITDIIELEKAE